MPALNGGSFEALGSEDQVLAYARNGEGRRLLILLNFGAKAAAPSSAMLPPDPIVLASTRPERPGSIEGPLVLAPGEGVVIGVRPAASS